MTITDLAKQTVGRVAWELGARSFKLRRALRPVGLRTRQAWYGGREGEVELYAGRTAVLGQLDESYLSFELFWKGWPYYEPLTIVAIHELLRGARTFFDVGGNIGYFAVSAASWYPDLRVVAFEPNPKLNRILTGNVRRNGLAVDVRAAAVSASSGEQTFHLPRSDMSGSLEASFNEEVEQRIQVRTTTLDEVAAQLESRAPLVIKVDVEGHEEAVLVGARELIGREGPDLVLEVTDDYETGTELLREAGYRFYVITERGLEAAERLATPRRGDLLYLNVLATRRDPAEVGAIAETIRHAARGLDLRKSSLLRPSPSS